MTPEEAERLGFAEAELINPKDETWFQFYDWRENAWVGMSVNAKFDRNLIALYRIVGASEGSSTTRCHLDIHRVAYTHEAYHACFERMASSKVAEGGGEPPRPDGTDSGRTGGAVLRQAISLYAVTDSRLAEKGENHVVCTIWLDPRDLGFMQISRRAGDPELRLKVHSTIKKMCEMICTYAGVTLVDGQAMREDYHSLYHVIQMAAPSQPRAEREDGSGGGGGGSGGSDSGN
jgi:hypothetical protein